MPKICDLKRGAVVEINGQPHVLEEVHVQSPSARGGASLYKMRFRHLLTKQKLDRTYRGDDLLENAAFSKREVQYLYCQGDLHTFMDLEDFSQFELTADQLGEQTDYLVEDQEDIYALIVDERVAGIELPPTVELTVRQCDPAIKGASATARTKPATLSTGLVIQVPEHISPGEVVRVDTRDARFLGRA